MVKKTAPEVSLYTRTRPELTLTRPEVNPKETRRKPELDPKETLWKIRFEARLCVSNVLHLTYFFKMFCYYWLLFVGTGVERRNIFNGFFYKLVGFYGKP